MKHTNVSDFSLLRCGSARNKVRAFWILFFVCMCDMLAMVVMVFSCTNPPTPHPMMTVKVPVCMLYGRRNDVLLLCSRIPASPGERDENRLQQQVISERC